MVDKLNIRVGLDFGLSYTDLFALQSDINGNIMGDPIVRFSRSTNAPIVEKIKNLFDDAMLDYDSIDRLAVTGGRHADLPDYLQGKQIIKINEITAIGATAHNAHAQTAAPQWPIVAVSTGTGTACVLVEENGNATHLGGTAIGGGTLMGLSSVMLQETDPEKIVALASAGDAAQVNLTIGEAIAGPIGVLPQTATAANFAKLHRHALDNKNQTMPREHIAAGIVQMVAEAIGRMATEAILRGSAKKIYILGRTITFKPLAHSILEVLSWGNFEVEIVPTPGSGTAKGALIASQNN